MEIMPRFVQPQSCCPGQEQVSVARIFLASDDSTHPRNIARKHLPLTQDIIDFKALSKRNGTTRIGSTKTLFQDGMQVKASRLGRSLVSIAIPGDSDPIRSPVRSAVYRTITPGKPGGSRGGSLPGQNRGYRCPEGYQYGGRFTDSRLSTCGAKLFDIPSPLGLALAAIRRAVRGKKPEKVTGTPLGAGQYPESLIQSRKPQIPKVSVDNRQVAAEQVKKLTSDIGATNTRVTRMVRRDGFVLEPVVPAKVLRAIPDNRDMEGATYILSALSPQDIGNDELGLLSNTGVRSLIYVLPGGSTLTLEKRRKLSVGERRKLGRTVNTAIESRVGNDPASRLKMVADETGDGIGYTENFVGLKNPNEVVNGKPRWATAGFKMRAAKAPVAPEPARKTVSNRAIGKKITDIDEAVQFLIDGGSLSQISAEILPQVLKKSKVIQATKLANNQTLITVGGNKYFLSQLPKRYQHMGEFFASDLQQHLGLESPDVFFFGKPGDKRQYFREDVETALQGSKLNPNIKFNDLDPQDVARMMVADFLTDQRERPNSSIYAMDTSEGVRAMLAQNITSGLTDLDKIEISKRIKMTIEDFYTAAGMPNYSEYYSQLKAQQQAAFRRYIDALINRARLFKMTELRRRMKLDGLSAGEEAHLKIIEVLFKNRLETLSKSKKTLVDVLRGE